MNTKVRAFSLVEVLVASAVLALMLVLVASVVNNTASVTGRGSGDLILQNEAQTVFSRILLDLRSRPQEEDLPSRLLKSSGDDSFALISQVPGLVGDRGISTVEYRVSDFFGRP